MFYEFCRKTCVLRIMKKKNLFREFCSENFWPTDFSEKIIFYAFPRIKMCVIFRGKNIFLIFVEEFENLVKSIFFVTLLRKDWSTAEITTRRLFRVFRRFSSLMGTNWSLSEKSNSLFDRAGRVLFGTNKIWIETSS